MPQFSPQTGHFRSEPFNFSVVLAGMVAIGTHAQIRQPVVVLVSGEMVDLFAGVKAPTEALCDDKTVLIDAPSLVGHWQIHAVERNDY